MPARKQRAVHALRSGSASIRLRAVGEFLQTVGVADEVLLVGASRGAVDDCARAMAMSRGVSFGVHRLSVTQLAARLAMLDLAASDRTPISRLGYEALATRATFDAAKDDALRYLAPVRHTPGFPRALAATLTELRLHGSTPPHLSALARSGPDLADLLGRVDDLLDTAHANDRAAFFEAAIARVEDTRDFQNVPVVLLDVAFDSVATTRFLLSLVRRAPRALITMPAGDIAAERALTGAGITIDDREEPRETDLARLHRHLFAERPPAQREPTGELVWLSAPGEARECVEIARRILKEAANGVRFDEMAILLRSPESYLGLLEHALDRAGIPAYFDRGTRRPDPAGRAFLALLACAAENLSAARFAEYLSLGQVPLDNHQPDEETWVIPDDDGLGLATPDEDANADAPESERTAAAPSTPGFPAPWRWERLLVESSVLGGADRWERRLDGLAEEMRTRIRALEADDPEDPHIDALASQLDTLRQLQAFALPIVRELDGWPQHASWGEWLNQLEPFARRVLKQPERVLRVLGALRPMSGIGPVGIGEIRAVLSDRLTSLYDPPRRPRYGKVFVASADDARGRAFTVVFVPGLAERLFPRAIHEDPLLVDDLRAGIDGLLQQDGRAALERLSLRLTIGAAIDRVYVSYPRLEAAAGRARVPSFYALEVMRAVTGSVPDHVRLARDAAETSNAPLAWPAPRDPIDAIDDFEHDLAVLRSLMADPAAFRGRAQYLVQLNPHLRRSLVSQWNRARSPWTSSDGIVRAADAVRPFLTTQRMSARPYSVSALQHYAACPYRFLLSAIYRLAPIETPAPLQHLDPLTRGSLFHETQAEVFRALTRASLMPPRREARTEILQLLEQTADAVARRFADRLAPAIARVWHDEIAVMKRDLYVWIDQVLDEPDWEPWRFELAFGLPGQPGHDENSLADPVTIDGRFVLRGSIDLVERKRGTSLLRVTDYKTSRNRSPRNSIVAGGTMLQPVLYSLAVEAATGLVAESGRFWYCTSAGGFSQHHVPISERVRRTGLDVLTIVDRAIELGTFPAAPAERACEFCDFRPACGPHQELRARRKSSDLLGDLQVLRDLG